MKQLIDYIPLIAFLVVYKMEERVISLGSFDYNLGGIFSATEILVTASILVYGSIFLVNGKLSRSHLFLLSAVVLFCSFTLIFREEAILKWKAPVVNWIFACVFIGSQFFITHQATPHLNGLHTVFGLIYSGKELIRQTRIGDTMISVTIEGNAKAFLERNADRVYQWNLILDENFPDLKPALTD